MAVVTRAGAFVLWALRQVGKGYRLGAEVKLRPEDFGNPYAFYQEQEWDCSELVQAGLWAAGVSKVRDTPVEKFDGAGFQFLHARPVPIALARTTNSPGLLVFVEDRKAYPDKPAGIGHVGIVIAQNAIVEARGRKWGVVVGPVRPSFTLAAKIDELYA